MTTMRPAGAMSSLIYGFEPKEGSMFYKDLPSYNYVVKFIAKNKKWAKAPWRCEAEIAYSILKDRLKEKWEKFKYLLFTKPLAYVTTGQPIRSAYVSFIEQFTPDETIFNNKTIKEVDEIISKLEKDVKYLQSLYDLAVEYKKKAPWYHLYKKYKSELQLYGLEKPLIERRNGEFFFFNPKTLSYVSVYSLPWGGELNIPIEIQYKEVYRYLNREFILGEFFTPLRELDKALINLIEENRAAIEVGRHKKELLIEAEESRKAWQEYLAKALKQIDEHLKISTDMLLNIFRDRLKLLKKNIISKFIDEKRKIDKEIAEKRIELERQAALKKKEIEDKIKRLQELEKKGLRHGELKKEVLKLVGSRMIVAEQGKPEFVDITKELIM